MAASSVPGLDVTADRLDRLMTLEVRPLSGGLPVGIVVPTYLAARQRQGAALCGLAAACLAEACAAGGKVLIASGAGVAPKLPGGETDGPPGAAVLARALFDAFGTQAVLVSQHEHLPAMRATAEIACRNRDGRAFFVTEFPKGEDAGLRAAQDLIDDHVPAAVVFVERDGPNETGHYHGVRGDRRPDGAVAHLHRLRDAAAARNIPTIGVGDGGNEIGFGLIRAEVSALLPDAGRCKVDESGVVTVTATDILLSASVSNWGCYAIVGALSVLASRNLLHTPAEEQELIEGCIAAGARDGATGTPAVAVDGISAAGNGAVVQLMRAIVDAAVVPRRMPETAVEPDGLVSSQTGLLGELSRAMARGGICP